MPDRSRGREASHPASSQRSDAAALSGVGPRLKLSASVARKIVAFIGAQDLRAGDVLPSERLMIEQMGVSRGTLREALRMLEAHGLISLRPGPSGGPVIERMAGRQLGVASTLHLHIAGVTFREIWEARLMTEPIMARLAAERDSTKAYEQLRMAIDDARGLAHAADEQWVASVSDFHTTISSMSGNKALDLWAVSLAEVWKIHSRGVEFPTEGRQKVFVAHDEIADAVRDRDGRRAYELMAQHNQEMMNYIDEQFPGLLDDVVPFII